MNENAYSYRLDAPVTVPPQRVVSLVPSVTESLFDLNLGTRLVGITDYCVRPTSGVAALPRIGGTKNPDVKRILSLSPDLVIANREENRKEDVAALQAAGVPVWVTFPRTVRDALNLLWAIMNVFDEPSMVPRVRTIEWSVDWAEAAVRAREETVCRVFVPIWIDPLMTFNADTYIHDLLRICGATNVFADRDRLFPLAADLGAAQPYPGDDLRVEGRDTRYPRVSIDEVIQAQPDVILLPSEPFAFGPQHIAIFGELDIPAARNHRIHLVDGSLLTWHGTRLAYALTSLPALFSLE